MKKALITGITGQDRAIWRNFFWIKVMKYTALNVVLHFSTQIGLTISIKTFIVTIFVFVCTMET